MPTELMHGQVIKEVNVMTLSHDDGGERLGELFNLSFSERDASLYLRPIAPNASYLCGQDVVAAGASEHVIAFDGEDRVRTYTPVKLSIHASGQVHAKLDFAGSQILAGPLQMPP